MNDKNAHIHPFRWGMLTVWCIAFTLIVAWSLNKIDNTVNDNKITRTVLCVRQDALRREVNRSLAYLEEVHSGRRKAIPGISDADILSGVRESRVEIISYNPLNCHEGG